MIALPELPYRHQDLEPVISRRTLRIHHGKHHRAYVDKVNTLVGGTPMADASLEDIVRWSARRAATDAAAAAIFNNAAQAWNHAFYWNSLRPRGGRGPGARLAALIATAFGSHDNFAFAFKSAAAGHFGSGWAWLVLTGTGLEIVATPNADTPLLRGQTPLLVVDVWEHAYYLDYQERRAAYVDALVNELLDWSFAEKNLARASAATASAAVQPAPAAAMAAR